ncbi:DUF4861 family protein [Roseateles cellulosilyticus]|uniref:DUF4861 domain-containing protein n=1 Tax=Pelomonas cellulosilytica TaxID=2906762 RepID=A0ABS8XTD3_9BURK|nr:DUF4861 family protein [Pelomonas sp. P8]MCE4553934.1 DUF4861 domain-containing protein [Pelomonas sp. P8]
MKHILSALVLALAALQAGAAERLVVTVTHELDAARPAETITVPWAEVNRVLPGALLQKIAVRDAAGHLLPYQVTNVAPQAKDPKGEGIAYGELIFQHDFAAGERQARFTVEKTTSVSPPFPTQAFARYVPERLDDFAWENDRIAHRTYGAALAAPAPPGSGKEVLETSGMDIWFKRPSYLVVDRWYNKGHDHYHKDEGEGLDMYAVGRTRGAGGTGIWTGNRLAVSRNYESWRVITNGPIRAVFELTYAPWDADGVQVSEVKRFTVDAGHWFDRVESTFTTATPQTLTVALGLNKKPAYPAQDPTVTPYRAPDTLMQWVHQRSAGDFGTAIILPGADGYAEDVDNELILAKARSGQPLRYYLGAGVSWFAEFPDAKAWQAHVAAYRQRLASPVSIRVGAE